MACLMGESARGILKLQQLSYLEQDCLPMLEFCMLLQCLIAYTSKIAHAVASRD